MNIPRRDLVTVMTTTLAILVALPSLAFADVEHYVVGVDGMACPFCAYGIEKKLEAIDGVEEVGIRIKDGEVDVPTTKTVTPDQIDTAIEKAGFGLRDLRLKGTGDVTTDGSLVIAFSSDLSLPLEGFAGSSGRYVVEGRVARRGDRWVLKLTKSEEAK